ncbi:MAG: hypothetical protein OXC01_14900 [Immundisolibacterales bacterium]|nr:hypothetical protein [Immundisolibacterales bacterium]
MAAVFDTRAAVRGLEAAGIDTKHAEAIVETMRDARTADTDQLATKADLKADLAELRADLYRALWIQGGAIVAIIAGFFTILSGLKLL